jgi:hypothetical protein
MSPEDIQLYIKNMLGSELKIDSDFKMSGDSRLKFLSGLSGLVRNQGELREQQNGVLPLAQFNGLSRR